MQRERKNELPTPKRSETVHVETLDEEVCVYDWQRKHVHALNPTAARVWQLCDGQTSPQQIAATLGAEWNVPDAEELVWLTLSKLEKAHLLAEPVVKPARRTLLPRRAFIQLGIAAALLPVVHSIVAPTPVEAQSPVPTTPPTATVPAATATAAPSATGAPIATATATATTPGAPSATTTATGAPTAAATATATGVPTATATNTPTTAPTVTPTPVTFTQTFNFTGAAQQFTVPAGVTSVTIQVFGAQGGETTSCGEGGTITATIPVTPGETLFVYVGGEGGDSTFVPPGPGAGGVGGFNGGGAGGAAPTTTGGGGGGGASDVRQGGNGLNNRVVVAGGGGGGDGYGDCSGPGAYPNGIDGGSADAQAGKGGTQTSGGAGGTGVDGGGNGTAGALGTGGTGGAVTLGAGGGGGGGGYYGGGGSGGDGDSSNNFDSSAGGGGSGYYIPTATNVSTTFGGRRGNGQVIISYP